MEKRLQTRRAFCAGACKTMSGLAVGYGLAELLTGCKDDSVSIDAPSLPTIQGVLSGGVVTVSAISNSPLSAVGSAALVQYSGGAVLVAQTQQTSFTALNSICTHQQCMVTGFKDQLYVCPCHGSQFQTNGQVARGPANSPLRMFATQFSNDQLRITI